jgi:cobalt transport protein ATP-binding subunit
MTASARPILSVRNLSYRYPGGVRALEDVSFEVRAGEAVGIVGPSGAGKSTLLMHLNGLLPERPPAAGEAAVVVDGLDVAAGNLPEIRRRVGFLFQDPDDQLFCPTVGEDVAFGPLNLGIPHDEVRRRITESLTAVGLTGYEDRSTLQLSVGERKRVCLAGVLACQPQVLALDEPSSNLDPRARRELIAILERFAGSRIVATHDLDLVAAHCNRVLVLDGGRIHAEGPPRIVLSDPVIMERHGLEVPLRLLMDPPSMRGN